MRFINCEQLHIDFGDRLCEGFSAEPFGRDVDELMQPAPDLAQPAVHFRVAQRAVDKRGGDAARRELVNLVFHQGYQRRDDQRNALDHQSGELKAERLAPARGHHDDRVFAVKNSLNYFGLPLAKVCKAEMFKKGFARPGDVAHTEFLTSVRDWACAESETVSNEKNNTAVRAFSNLPICAGGGKKTPRAAAILCPLRLCGEKVFSACLFKNPVYGHDLDLFRVEDELIALDNLVLIEYLFRRRRGVAYRRGRTGERRACETPPRLLLRRRSGRYRLAGIF